MPLTVSAHARLPAASAMAAHDPRAPLKFLVIRRDNIGDLVCTTPVFEALRAHFPAARIYALTNSYNLALLRGNPFVDEAFAYTKAKHRPAGVSAARVYWERARLIARLRALHIDYAILAGAGFVPRALGFARWLRPRHIVGYVESGAAVPAVDMPVAYRRSRAVRHHVEDVFGILAALGIDGAPPPLRVVPDAAARVRAEAAWSSCGLARPPIAVHISARKPSTRWPPDRFVALMKRIHAADGLGFMLFWSPGEATNPLHPGDDDKARKMLRELHGVPVVSYPTERLDDLIAGLSVCERVICGDGGAMHIAAALGKPILCFFGDSDATHWRPWGVPYVLLQPLSRDVADISVAEAAAGIQRLAQATQSSVRANA
jgi:heptosyltransferase-3